MIYNGITEARETFYENIKNNNKNMISIFIITVITCGLLTDLFSRRLPGGAFGSCLFNIVSAEEGECVSAREFANNRVNITSFSKSMLESVVVTTSARNTSIYTNISYKHLLSRIQEWL